MTKRDAKNEDSSFRCQSVTPSFSNQCSIVKTPIDRIMNLRVLIINVKKKYSIDTILNGKK